MECFFQQSYSNCEMIISYPETDQDTKIVLNKLKHPSIILIVRKAEKSLGEARNEAIDKCNGEYICIWDDDDWHHPERISRQIRELLPDQSTRKASVLTRIFLFDHTTRKAYLSFPYTWDGTLLCRKAMLMQNQYAHRNYGEDTHIISFLESRSLLSHIDDAPNLYVYIYHGDNTWPYSHFDYFLQRSTPLNLTYTETVLKLII